MSMTVKDVFTTINSAHQIKKWPGEYRVYSKENTVFIYCNEAGLPKCFVHEINGFQHPLTDAESKIVNLLVNGRYSLLCHEAKQATTSVKTK
jgi:hypothetical protein